MNKKKQKRRNYVAVLLSCFPPDSCLVLPTSLASARFSTSILASMLAMSTR